MFRETVLDALQPSRVTTNPLGALVPVVTLMGLAYELFCFVRGGRDSETALALEGNQLEVNCFHASQVSDVLVNYSPWKSAYLRDRPRGTSI